MDEALTAVGCLPKSPREELPPVFPSSHLKTRTTCPALTGCRSSLRPGGHLEAAPDRVGTPSACQQAPCCSGHLSPHSHAWLHTEPRGPRTGSSQHFNRTPTRAKRTSTRLIWGPAWNSAETLRVHQGSQRGHTDHAPHRPRLPGAAAGTGSLAARLRSEHLLAPIRWPAWLQGGHCASLQMPTRGPSRAPGMACPACCLLSNAPA